MSKQNKFHGMTIVSDQQTVKDNYVIEENSNGDLVCRHYDETGYEDEEPIVLDIADFCTAKFPKKVTETNIFGYIKKTIGKNSVLISEGAIEHIRQFLE